MYKGLIEYPLTCPYCWEGISILVDNSVSSQETVEDCEVCCQPMRLLIEVDGDQIQVDAKREDD